MSEVNNPPAEEKKNVQEQVAAPECKKGGKCKKILRVTGVVIGAVLCVLILLFLFRDPLIELGVRHIGSFVTGTEVTIASFDSSLKGTVELKEIRVANPRGYQKPCAFEIDRIYVKIDPATLTSDEPVVEVVEVTGVRIDMEIKGTKSNLSEIQANVEKIAGSSPKAEKSEKKKEADSNAPAPLIKKIALTSMGISFSSSTFHSSVPVPLAPIYLNNIGGKGQPLGETLFKVFETLMRSINAVASTVVGGVEAIGNAGKAVGSGLVDGAAAIGDAGKKAGQGVVDGVKSIGGSVGSIFKKK